MFSIHTANLNIRNFVVQDYADFKKLICDKMNSPYAVYDEPFPTDDVSLKNVLDYFTHSDEFFAIEYESRHQVIGFITLNSIDEASKNLGFCIHSDFQRKGYAFEAVTAIKVYAKDTLQLVNLVSGTADLNIPSVKLLEKSGFILKSKSKGSFVNDKDGHPIEFIGGSYECLL